MGIILPKSCFKHSFKSKDQKLEPAPTSADVLTNLIENRIDSPEFLRSEETVYSDHSDVINTSRLKSIELLRSEETLYYDATDRSHTKSIDSVLSSETSDYGTLGNEGTLKRLNKRKSGKHQMSKYSTVSSVTSDYYTLVRDKKSARRQSEQVTAVVEPKTDAKGSSDNFEEHMRKEKYEFLNCTKQPEHSSFIPIQSFSIESLPQSYQSQEIYNLVIALSTLVVRIKVSAISPNRPKHWPGIETPYSWPDDVQDKTVFGTGRVEEVTKGQESCPCETCKTSSAPSEFWWLIRVVTASHVVFDDLEAQHTSCELFYDSESSKVTSIKGLRLASSDMTKDLSKLLCVTCDVTLAEKLEKCVDTFIDAWETAFDKYFGDQEAAKENLVILIFHPHGYYKHLSVGHYIETHKELNDDKELQWSTYNTPTCTGSDGAYVLNTKLFHSFD
ncbi:uncharacterized protein LOC106079695 isoform X1 [Biomphalaria glabrata]|uniref:Uncharacterized protein LOC106079695 isoform X1 n=1 Tax=Biomphalaria glabrata TaxID=6526 RepID=A0A9U8ENN7_BIOGL|nr:uncharacterized protein LOC106079695 isoform X1 [Biomphalaria glabrata]